MFLIQSNWIDVDLIFKHLVGIILCLHLQESWIFCTRNFQWFRKIVWIFSYRFDFFSKSMTSIRIQLKFSSLFWCDFEELQANMKILICNKFFSIVYFSWIISKNLHWKWRFPVKVFISLVVDLLSLFFIDFYRGVNYRC